MIISWEKNMSILKYKEYPEKAILIWIQFLFCYFSPI